MAEIGNDAPSLRESQQPWLNEPNEKAWTDEATGYQCLASRGPHGAWCGYVMVPKDHPAHGASYYKYSIDLDEFDEWPPARVALQRQINDITVHGGLTFAGEGRLFEGGALLGWWFGFDCAHSGDYSPSYDRPNHPVLGLGKPTGYGEVITYRDLAYVEAECARLAQQLSEIARNGDDILKDNSHG